MVQVGRAAVSFRGSLETGYRACLWSRCASRVLFELGRFSAPDAAALYAGAKKIDWSIHMDVTQTFAVRATGTNRNLRHTGFVAQQVKDAIADSFRDRLGKRPSVEVQDPDIQIQVHIEGARATVSLDMAGTPLHRRGYRVKGAQAPLKETVASAMLLLAGWPQIAKAGGAFVDPMCGGGTLPIEAAWIAGDRAPGLLRKRFGFEGWLGHDGELWQRLRNEAQKRAEAGRASIPPIVGYEADKPSVAAAHEALSRAGLTGLVHVERRELQNAAPPSRRRRPADAGREANGRPEGLLAVNPPYGHRLGEVAQLRILYASLGRIVADRFSGYRVAVLTPEEALAASLGLGKARQSPLRNGSIACTLFRYDPDQPKQARDQEQGKQGAASPKIDHPPPKAGGIRAEAEGFANRLRKRAKHVGRWAKRQGVTCYRIYDADLPEYAVAVDRYEDFVHVQEYAPPATVDPALAAQRLADVMATVPAVLDVPADHVFVKVRKRQKGRSQYRKIGEGGVFHEVREGGHRFLVNFEDYLDTGLFLDHRLVRVKIQSLAKNRRFLNLFCYTASATVYAAKGGAVETTSVDRSGTYLGWARRNLALNGLSERKNRIVRADARSFLAETSEQWDLIFVDPPTFSNTKSGDPPFDVQRDHADLLTAAAKHLSANGVILFSTNLRRFKLDEDVLGAAGFQVEDISAQTLPEDFQRSPRIHKVFELHGKIRV